MGRKSTVGHKGISTTSEQDLSETDNQSRYNDESANQAQTKTKKKSDDKTFGITVEEFGGIAFDLDWPYIVKDLAHYMIGVDMLKGSRISEADELPQAFAQEMCKDQDIHVFRQQMKPNDWQYMLNSFRVLEGKEQKAMNKADIEKLKDATQNYSETNIYLEEKHFTENIDKLFPKAPAFFGKMLYIWMAKGFDKVKISLLRFLECMYPIFNLDNRFNHNKIAFLLLDIDRDNVLNIVNLLHLQRNLNPKSKIG